MSYYYADWMKRKTKSNGELYSENTVGAYVSSLSTAPARLTSIELPTVNIFEITIWSIDEKSSRNSSQLPIPHVPKQLC
ncbi:hypothetical protein [Paenibacillus macquariensis]|uniref:hypothetical protein n=1 Tax=Paenibacillus macquariensis TaxID=948756 RepID=UPI0012E90AEB|nr:hypothetical protein [Paenibacillus macquariensis]MEC0093138.1 hypothetical protein [Paenibacillus macquariensis]